MSVRVSDILSYFVEPYLVRWYAKNGVAKCEAIKNEALSIGTVVDQLVQDRINGKDTIPQDYLHQFEPQHEEFIVNCMKGWGKFKKDHPEVLERMRKYKDNMQRELVLGDLVGHPDFILGDEVCDLKTSKSISKSHWMQTAQYARMWDEMNKAQDIGYRDYIRKVSILRLDKADPNGFYEYKVLEEPFITFWQGKFEARYQAFREDQEFNELMRKKLEAERLS